MQVRAIALALLFANNAYLLSFGFNISNNSLRIICVKFYVDILHRCKILLIKNFGEKLFYLIFGYLQNKKKTC